MPAPRTSTRPVAKAEIAAARAEVAFDLREVDVSLDPGLNREYGERIPVVEVDGSETFELHVDVRELLRALDRVRS